MPPPAQIQSSPSLFCFKKFQIKVKTFLCRFVKDPNSISMNLLLIFELKQTSFLSSKTRCLLKQLHIIQKND
ncbi:unnamed protein product [Paramecium pentaurelia]|uniref:Uncharacterized protein n=1 Tax=Paramecium pentaurelia TaxID=43138 RepID=A0A8S1YS07_9CILI|nr:unnamed protein product [Paramecium pentaurelia]